MIDNLQISQSKETPFFPGVSFDALTGVCEIYGESYMEDTFKFYSPIFNWLKRYTVDERKPVTFNVKLTYFNTSSSRALLDIFDILKKYKDDGGSVVVNWYYDPEDPDMKYEVEDFRVEAGIDINLLELG